jgi:hypothetical protein
MDTSKDANPRRRMRRDDARARGVIVSGLFPMGRSWVVLYAGGGKSAPLRYCHARIMVRRPRGSYSGGANVWPTWSAPGAQPAGEATAGANKVFALDVPSVTGATRRKMSCHRTPFGLAPLCVSATPDCRRLGMSTWSVSGQQPLHLLGKQGLFGALSRPSLNQTAEMISGCSATGSSTALSREELRREFVGSVF